MGTAMRPTKTTDPVLEEIVERLVQLFAPERICLFGSKARGDDDADSDYDVLIVVSSSDEPMYRRAQRAPEALWGVPAAVDVLVFTQEEFERKLTVVCSLPSTVVEEGELVYAA
jgi:predicted nucleotidyltransferase